MKKRIFLIILVSVAIILPVHDVSAYKFNFITVSDVVSKVKKKFKTLKTYQANFVITITKGGRKKTQTGVIRYKADDKMFLHFYRPYGQKIISNGKTLIIYIPSMNVVAEQDLKKNKSILSAGTKTGLRRLFSKYHYRFASKDQPEVQKDGSKRYTLHLRQKESRGGIKVLKLWVTEKFIIERAQGKTSTGKTINISFSKIKTNISIQNGVFKFDIPAHARTIKNPMIAED